MLKAALKNCSAIFNVQNDLDKAGEEILFADSADVELPPMRSSRTTSYPTQRIEG